ncbi:SYNAPTOSOMAL ASSOCIATED PROTEIN [Salix viminalis]|uniref:SYNAPTOSOMAL ASSOCIATED PROTEIN n=1 Tax=Salix viminalis TaxID=40686 RepID=A0A9Q0SD33_SALVM|nr:SYNAPTOSOMAL ASSOCIATED PROTEIN [Salix viminalis]
MFYSKKSPLKISEHNKADPECPAPSRSNPFEYENEVGTKKTLKPSRKTSSESDLTTPKFSTNPFDNDEERGLSSSSTHSLASSTRHKYKDDFLNSGGLENQPDQELENYAVYKAEETSKAVNGCLKIAEEMREGATTTLITLHQQGEQITKTHSVAVEIDHDLSRGEKILGSLGGMLSKTWNPKKNRPIRGPVITRDALPQGRGNHLDQREKLGLNLAPKEQSSTRTPLPETANAFQKVEFEKSKQDDALSDLSNVIGELKNMAADMGTEFDRQAGALDHIQDDVDELNFRVGGANKHGLHLLRK